MIRAMIVDDEIPSLDRMEKLLAESNLAEVAGKFSESAKALAFLSANRVDAVFLDIEMPDMDGIELAGRILDLLGNIPVIFVTAYNQYAVEAFRLNALDYLLKPVSAERLRETLCRILPKTDGVSESGEGLSIRCFGGFRVQSGGQDIHFRTEKAEELFAFLIGRRGGPVSREKIIDCLWEEFDGDRALVHFNTTLYNVKKAFLSLRLPLTVRYERGCYRMDTNSMNCDYLRFCSFAKDEKPVTADTLRDYEGAAALYTGEYLAGREYGWAAGVRLSLEDQWTGMLARLSDYYKRGGEYEKAARWLKAGLLHEPLHRELNYRMIGLLQAAHEYALAGKYYEVYKAGLREKFGKAPDEAFVRLMRD